MDKRAVREDRKKAIVIGTGIGGSGMAAQLAQAGFDVTILERNNFWGGKTAAYERDGFVMDIATHTSPRCERGPIGDVCRRVHVDLEWRHKEPSLKLYLGDRSCCLHQKFWLPQYLIRAEMAFRFLPTPALGLGLLRLACRIMMIRTRKDIKRYEGITAYEILKADIKNQRLLDLFEVLTSLMMVVSSREASAAEFLWNLATWFKKSKTGYPKGGYGNICNSLIESCKKNGGVLKLGEAAKRIRVKDGKVEGVETDQGFYPADIVVSNAGFKPTVYMAGAENFTKQFMAYTDKLQDSMGAAVVQYAVDKKIVDNLVTVTVPDGFKTDTYIKDAEEKGEVCDLHIYIVCPTLVDPELAPEGKHILLACVSAPKDLKYMPVGEKILDKIEDTLDRMFPDLKNHTLWKVRRNLDFIASLGGRGRAEAIGLGQRYDQDGKNAPNPRLPIKGLYIVGADAGGTGIGTELAADSALNVFDFIMEDVSPFNTGSTL